MDDMRAIMQDELKQALVGLLPPPVASSAPAAIIPPVVINPLLWMHHLQTIIIMEVNY